MNNGEITLSREAFIIEHPAFFKDNSLLKGAFLLGCLTGILVRAQEKNLGNKPIYKRLNNLSIGTDELISLHPRLVNKIAQYQERKRPNGLPSDREVEDLIIESGSLIAQGGKASRDETSFAFTLGLTMQKKFSYEDYVKSNKAKKEAEATSTAS